MPRPDPKAPGDGQESMFEALPTSSRGHVLRGRHSEAVDTALNAARAAGALEDIDEAMATFVRSAAWAVDKFEKSGLPYGPAKLLQPVTEALRELRMTPESRQSDTDDSIKELLNDLAAADADPEVPHREDAGAGNAGAESC